VLLDIARGYVSAEAAAALYGVVIAHGAVDPVATAARWARLAHATHFHFGPERDAFEVVWDAGNDDSLTRILSALPVHWRFITETKVFAAMAATPVVRPRMSPWPSQESGTTIRRCPMSRRQDDGGDDAGAVGAVQGQDRRLVEHS